MQAMTAITPMMIAAVAPPPPPPLLLLLLDGRSGGVGEAEGGGDGLDGISGGQGEAVGGGDGGGGGGAVTATRARVCGLAVVMLKPSALVAALALDCTCWAVAMTCSAVAASLVSMVAVTETEAAAYVSVTFELSTLKAAATASRKVAGSKVLMSAATV